LQTAAVYSLCLLKSLVYRDGILSSSVFPWILGRISARRWGCSLLVRAKEKISLLSERRGCNHLPSITSRM